MWVVGYEAMFLSKKAKVLFSFLAVTSMRVFSYMFWLGALFYCQDCSMDGIIMCVTGFFLVVTLSASHLSGLNFIINVSSHFCKLSKSVWRARQSSLFRTFLHNRQSSALILQAHASRCYIWGKVQAPWLSTRNIGCYMRYLYLLPYSTTCCTCSSLQEAGNPLQRISS